jgi:hypothetical protein
MNRLAYKCSFTQYETGLPFFCQGLSSCRSSSPRFHVKVDRILGFSVECSEKYAIQLNLCRCQIGIAKKYKKSVDSI